MRGFLEPVSWERWLWELLVSSSCHGYGVWHSGYGLCGKDFMILCGESYNEYSLSLALKPTGKLVLPLFTAPLWNSRAGWCDHKQL